MTRYRIISYPNRKISHKDASSMMHALRAYTRDNRLKVISSFISPSGDMISQCNDNIRIIVREIEVI